MKNICENRNFGISLFIMFLTTALSNQYILAQDSLDMSNVEFEIVCNDTVSVNEEIHIGFVLDYGDQFNPDFLELKMPQFKTECAKLLYMGKTSTSTSLNIINGKKTTTHKVKWGATIRTIKEGRFLTPDVILLCQNDTVDISPKFKTIVITDEMNKDIQKKDFTQNDTVAKIPDNAIIELKISLDKGTICFGDSVLMQVKLQSDQSFSEVMFVTPIEIDDCFYESRDISTDNPVHISVEGKDCLEWTILEYVLTPLKSGIIKIPEIKIKGNCIIREEVSDPFWGTSKFYDVPFQTKSQEIMLNVKEK